MRIWRILAACIALTLSLWAGAADDPSCRSVRLADVGWSDVAASTGLASVVLEGLGYRPSVAQASVSVTFTGIRNRQIDAFVGYWKPHMQDVAEPFVKAGQVRVLDQPNLAGVRHTLAVPDYLYDKGLRSVDDIARFSKDLQGRILGIEPGSDGNAQIAGMIRQNRYGLGAFTLAESSEAAMLAEVKRAVRARRAVLFLAWEPHPMNTQVKLNYLSGGDEVFGAGQGAANVYTVLAPAFQLRCPNAARLLSNLRFTPAMIAEVMAPIMEKGRPDAAARNFLKREPQSLDAWLEGVTTLDGREPMASVLAAIRR